MTKKGDPPRRGQRQGDGKGQAFQSITYSYNSDSELLNFSDSSDNFDSGPEEIILSTLLGYDDCFSYYFRQSYIKRITQKVKKLRGGGY